MNDKFFPELTRRLRQAGIPTSPTNDKQLPVLVNGQEAMWVQPWGAIFLSAGAVNDPAVNRVYDTVVGTIAQVREYTEAMAAAPRLEAAGLHEGFRLLSDFNGVVLAGREMAGGLGYEFVTWRWSADHGSVANGNYYHDDYDGAKLDFACRAGLVQDSRQFTDEQLTEIYRCIHETLESSYPITREREDLLIAAANRIESSVDDLAERVEQSNRRELEAAQEPTDTPALGL